MFGLKYWNILFSTYDMLVEIRASDVSGRGPTALPDDFQGKYRTTSNPCVSSVISRYFICFPRILYSLLSVYRCIFDVLNKICFRL